MLQKGPLMMLASMLLLSAVTCAADKPDKCPDAETIKAQGVRYLGNLGWDTWYVSNISYYDTKNDWNFAIHWEQRTSTPDPMTYGRALLTTLHGNPTPVLGPYSSWSCYYKADGATMARAFLR